MKNIFLIITLLIVPAFAAGADDALTDTATDTDNKIGRVSLIEIVLPITGKTTLPVTRTLERIAAESRNTDQKPTVILQFTVEGNQSEFGRGSSFGACYELADFISGEKLGGVKTVAYLPQSVRGHVLLPALACEEIVMPDETTIGEAGCDETTITPTTRQAYLDINARKRRLPAALIEKLLNPKTNLLQVETESGMKLGTSAELEKLRETTNFVSEPITISAAGQPCVLEGSTARKLQLVDLLADDKIALSRGLGIRPDQIRAEPLVAQHGHAVRVDLTDVITPSKVNEIMRQLRSVVGKDWSDTQPQLDGRPVDCICIYVDSPGGNLAQSLTLASFIADDIDSSKVRTIAFVPNQALADAALIVLACDEVVLSETALLGGDGAVEFDASELSDLRQTIIRLTQKSVRGWSLPLGMVDRDISIFKMTRAGTPPVVDYFCEEELAEQTDSERWQLGECIKVKGQHFQTNGKAGLELRLVDRNASTFREFKTLYNLENDPTLLEPSWVDVVVRGLASPGMAILLLMVGLAGIWGEMKMPGTGIGITIAVICFALFFWSKFLGGTAGWLEITLFLLGLVFLMVEFFVLPGFGICGVIGILFVVSSIVLASQTFIIPRNTYQLGQIQNSLLILLLSLVGFFAIAMLGVRIIHDANRSQDDAEIAESEKLADYEHLNSQKGVATTKLLPSGKARFGDEIVSVVSDGEVIEPGEDVEVVAVVGYRIVVRRIV
ncbi:MAG: hypothetical protein LBU65_01230 [Planctomycetaceae bacterium]|jgi:membrane-bound ClpP family serine protease|nr:hypothetical protein [Planctomycetaceae bacterium]